MANLEVFDYLTPSPSDSRSSCSFDVDFTDCPLTAGVLVNFCSDPMQVVTLLYTGVGCDNSPSAWRLNATCVVHNGGPSSQIGSPAYITATSSDGGDKYFAGPVNVGDELTINSNKEFATLPKDLKIQIFRSRGGNLLQTVTMDLTCTNDIVLLTEAGGLSVTSWTEIGGREVGVFTMESQYNRPTYDFPLLVSVTGGKPLRITHSNVINSESGTMDSTPWVAGQVLQPFAPQMLIPGIPVTHDLYTDILLGWRYLSKFFAIMRAETLDGEECSANAFLDCDFRGS